MPSGRYPSSTWTTIQRQKLARQHAQVCMPVGSLENRKQFKLMPVVSWCRAHVENPNQAVRMYVTFRAKRNVPGTRRTKQMAKRNKPSHEQALSGRARKRKKQGSGKFRRGTVIAARGAQSDRSISSSPRMAWHGKASRKHEESDAVVLIRYRYILTSGRRRPLPGAASGRSAPPRSRTTAAGRRKSALAHVWMFGY